jgi:sigma-B regulation protein RsbU (phosphoserine phosphatase)
MLHVVHAAGRLEFPVPSRRTLAIVFGALLTLYSVSWMYLIRQESQTVVGIDTEFKPIAQALLIRLVTPGSPAAAAGLQPGDRVRAIDGRRMDRYEPFLDLRRHGRPGQRVVFDVERDGATRQVPVTLLARDDVPATRQAAAWSRPGAAMRFVQQVLALYPIPFLVVTLVVLLQRPEDPHAWLLALMLGGFIAGAGIAEFEYRVPLALRGPLLAFSTLLGVPLAAVTYAFFSGFPAHAPVDRRLPWLKYVGLALGYGVAAVLAAGALARQGSYSFFWLSERLEGWSTWMGVASLVYWMGFFVLALVSLLQNAFGPPDVRRKTRVILFGLIVGWLPIIALQLTAEAVGLRPQQLPPWIWASSILALFAIPLSLGYAVVKHRAMEIPVLLRRSARYLLVRRGLVTAAVLAGVFVTLGFARLVDSVALFSDMDRTRGGLVVGSVFGGLLVFAGRRVWQPAMERLDRAFFRGAYDSRHTLMTLAEQTRTATDRTTLAEMIDHAVVQALHPATLLVFLRGRDDWTFEAAAHEGLSGSAAQLPASPDQLTEIAKRGSPLLLDPAQLETGGAWASFAPMAPEALVPLAGRSGRMEGLLVLGPRLSEEPYSGEDVSLLASVGTQSGLALENIRLAETMAARIEAERRAARELEIAREVQAKLLPQDRPALASLDYAGVCQQARIVGGDYFDFVSLAPDQFGLVLADISGKGISAALLMASLQANLRAQYARAPNDLAAVLGSVNKVFFDSTASNHYATLFFGVYEESCRRLRYANCGHLPPVLLRACGTVERLGVTAPVVGLFETPWSCGTGEARLGPGDTLVIFTDGVSDATSDSGEEFGEERLVDLLKQHAGSPAPAVLEAIVGAVRDHSADEQFDDLTLIVARVR